MEKVLINRINHVSSHDLMNNNQYEFTPQRGTIDVANAVKDFVEKGLIAGKVTVLVSLHVKGTFDAASWSSILNGLKAGGCPRNLYNLTKSYFSKRTTVLSTNSVRIEREVSKGCLQGPCCVPGFWNILYNSLLKLKFTERTKAIAFADDLILAIRAKRVSEVENFSNLELTKITAWSKSNKIIFSEEKYKIMLIMRRK